MKRLPGYALKKDDKTLWFRMNPQFSHIMWASGRPKTDVPLEACEFLREINGLEPQNSSSKKRVGFCLQSLTVILRLSNLNMDYGLKDVVLHQKKVFSGFVHDTKGRALEQFRGALGRWRYVGSRKGLCKQENLMEAETLLD